MAKKSPVPKKQDAVSAFADAPVLTAQEKAKLAQEAKTAHRAEKREWMRQMKAAAKATVKSDSDPRQMTVILVVILAIIVLFVGAMVFSQVKRNGWEPEEGRTYFLDQADLPEIVTDQVDSVINEVYYTRNGGLYVQMNFGNGYSTARHPTRIQVKLMNGKNEVIAFAANDQVHEDYYIIEGGYKQYELYIPKKFVEIADDPLSEISYEITVDTEDYNSDSE